jgi:hypothetical protein
MRQPKTESPFDGALAEQADEMSSELRVLAGHGHDCGKMPNEHAVCPARRFWQLLSEWTT